jgi:hypothetical protein
MLWDAGWVVNVKRIERIWRLEGLKVPQKQPKRGRLWLNDGSCNYAREARCVLTEFDYRRVEGSSCGDPDNASLGPACTSLKEGGLPGQRVSGHRLRTTHPNPNSRYRCPRNKSNCS